jgi:rare lipoprotein A (peptidoglycan hydrolase)
MAQTAPVWDPFGLWDESVQAQSAIRAEVAPQKAAPALKSRAVVYPAAAKGAKMSNGQAYDPKALTIAHDSLPIGSTVSISAGGKTVTATVTDRLTRKKDKKRDATHFVVSAGVARSLGVKRGDTVRLRAHTLPGEGTAIAARPLPATPLVANSTSNRKTAHQTAAPTPMIDTPFAEGMVTSMPKDSFSPYDSLIMDRRLAAPVVDVDTKLNPNTGEAAQHHGPGWYKSRFSGKMYNPELVKQDIVQTLEWLGTKHDDAIGYAVQMNTSESHFDPWALNKRTLAAGPGQTIPQTTLGLIKQYGHHYGLDEIADHIYRVKKTKKDGTVYYVWRADDANLGQVLASLPHDPKVSAILTAEGHVEGRQSVSSLIGRPVRADEQYLIHFLGPRQCAKLINNLASHPDMSAAKLLPREAEQNKAWFYSNGRPRTVRELYDLVRSKTEKEAFIVIKDRSDPRLKQAFVDALAERGVHLKSNQPEQLNNFAQWTGLADLEPFHARPITAKRESTAVVQPFSAVTAARI